MLAFLSKALEHGVAGLVGLAIGLIVTAIALLTLFSTVPEGTGEDYLNATPVECETFAVAITNEEYGYAYVGYRRLCGYGLFWENIKGPLSMAPDYPDGLIQ